MHIKQVIISGFRSFQSQSELEPLSTKHNVIVGRNGSGKSNFFDAIQFVLLGPRFSLLRQEDKQHLLHEGAGSSVLAAYVEIIFDNADGRLAVESDEVVLRRTMGLKKDEFFLNRKRVQKTEVQSLLERAGFSKSNPYYVVQQGKVANLCIMKDSDRLELLKEIAGTNVYDDKRSESLKLLQDASVRKDRIMEVLTVIDERMNELDKEKEEFSEFESLDKCRRALEYTLHDHEISKAMEQLNQLEIVKNEEQTRQQSIFEKYCNQEQQLQELLEERESIASVLLRLQDRYSIKSTELSRKQIDLVTMEEYLAESDNQLRVKTDEKEKFEEALIGVRSVIEECRSKLSSVEPKCLENEQELLIARTELSSLHLRVEALYGKQGRGRQFQSKRERDSFLQDQISSLTRQLSMKQEAISKSKIEITAVSTQLSVHDVSSHQLVAGLNANVSLNEELSKQILIETRNRNDKQELRKSCWKSLEDIQEKVEITKSELDRSNQRLNSCIPRHIAHGLMAVERFADEQKLSGYYGPLIDNFVLKNEGFRRAVETAAGNALFHIVVDSDETAAVLMKELDARKAGRLTFLPLNRLRNIPVTYPDTSDAKSLIEVALEYKSHLDPAIKQVFGKKLIARDLEVAAQLSKDYELDVVTKDGDVVNRRGGFEGGYHDDRGSKIEAVYKVRESVHKLENLIVEETKLSKQSEAVDSEVNDAIRKLQALEAERSHVRVSISEADQAIASLRKEQKLSQQQLSQLKSDLIVLDQDHALLTGQIETYRVEISSALTEKLTVEEQEELANLTEQERQQKRYVEDLLLKNLELTRLQEGLLADLNDNFLRREAELLKKLSSSFVSDPENIDQRNEDRETVQANLKFVILEVGNLEKEVKELENQLEKKRKENVKIEQDIQSHTEFEATVNEQLNDASKMQEKLLNKRSMLMDIIQKKQRMNRDLGAISRKELDKYKGENEKSLMKSLKSVNESLKKFSSVNKKALEQFVTFNDQRERLIERQELMDKDTESIKSLIDNLDAQKEEAILRTFNGVSRHFSDVFSELVTGGKGQLIMKTQADEKEVSNSNASQKKGKASSVSVSSFVGVEVRVSFASSGQNFEMQQLSGGQKTLVALALIFAIQRCDPAPFYLFDEIDQALDASYRANVARLIQKQTESEDSPAQFITTTFRPELVAVADKCYGIALLNKVSNIYPMEKAAAQNFVTTLMNEEEAVGKVCAVPNFLEVAKKPNNSSPEQESVADSENEDEDDDDDEEDDDNDDDDDAGLDDLKQKVEAFDVHMRERKQSQVSPGKRKAR